MSGAATGRANCATGKNPGSVRWDRLTWGGPTGERGTGCGCVFDGHLEQSEDQALSCRRGYIGRAASTRKGLDRANDNGP